jgi:hypothetical protein
MQHVAERIKQQKDKQEEEGVQESKSSQPHTRVDDDA